MDFAQVVEPGCGRGLCLALIGHHAYAVVLARERDRARGLGLPTPTINLQSPGPCMAVSCSSAVIGPDGALWKCPEDIGLAQRAYGSVFDSDVKLSNLVPWLTYDWFRYRECDDCTVLPQCAGGCPHRRLFPIHDAEPGENCYWSMRGNLKERIRQYANQPVSRHNSDLL
jgi:radical SAM protein with 4Fe4S-binding SPASM domain